MKKANWMLAIMLISIVFPGCKKDVNDPDVRQEVMGTYQLNCQHYSWEMGTTPDTSQMQQSLTITLDADNNRQVVISFAGGKTFILADTTLVDSYLFYLSGTSNWPHNGGTLQYFDPDSIVFTYRDGALGFSDKYDCTGSRQP